MATCREKRGNFFGVERRGDGWLAVDTHRSIVGVRRAVDDNNDDDCWSSRRGNVKWLTAWSPITASKRVTRNPNRY